MPGGWEFMTSQNKNQKANPKILRIIIHGSDKIAEFLIR